jgi:nucleoside diphosphate kinase
MSTERTYIMIKPDGVQRGLVGEIIARFEKKVIFFEEFDFFMTSLCAESFFIP